MNHPDSISSLQLLRFLEEYWADHSQGEDHGLAHYLARFPGHEEAVAAEYLNLSRQAKAGVSPENSGQGEAAHRIGPYRLERQIGHGGQGAVWQACDERLDRSVALKLLHRHPAPEEVQRFHREAAVAARLDHPGISGVLDVGSVDGTGFLAMRLIEGETLAFHIARQQRSGAACVVLGKGEGAWSRVADIVLFFEKAARALHEAHEAAIVHRDIKPANIMVGPTYEPTILDFGLAKDLSEKAARLTATSDVFGTPAYMAPEQLEGLATIDRRADIWSLAVSAYEALTLVHPFSAPTRSKLSEAIRRQPVPDPRRHHQDLPRDLCAVLKIALEKDPNLRYRTAWEFAEDLLRVRTLVPIRACPPSAPARALRWARREPFRAAAVGLAIVLVFVGAWLLVQLPGWRENSRIAAQQALEDTLVEAFFELGEGRAVLAEELFERALAEHPQSVESLAGLALAHAHFGRFDQALELLESHPASSPSLRWVLAEVLALSGREEKGAELRASLPDPSEALELFLRGMARMQAGHDGQDTAFRGAADDLASAALAASRALYTFEYAHALGHLPQGEAADETLRVALAIEAGWPASPSGLFWAGYALRAHHPELAVPVLEKSLALDASSSIVWLQLAVSLEEIGRIHDAETLLKRALARFRDDPDLLRVLGSVQYSQGELGPARDAWKRAFERSHGDERQTILYPRVLNELGDFEEAEPIWRAWRERHPEDWFAAKGHGDALSGLGRGSAAIEAYRRATECAPQGKRADPLIALAQCLADAGRGEDALKEAERAQRLAPNSPEVLAAYGQILTRLGRPSEALPPLLRATGEAPDHPAGWLALGIAYRQLGRLDDAERSYRKGLEGDVESVGLWNNLGGLLLDERGDAAGAAEAFERAIASHPEETAAIYGLANALRRLQRNAEAEARYREVLDLDPEYAEAWCNLGVLLQGLSRFEDAVNCIEKGHRIGSARRNWRYPSDEWLERAKTLRDQADDLKAQVRALVASGPAAAEDLLFVSRKGRDLRLHGLLFEAWRQVLDLESAEPLAYIEAAVCALSEPQWPKETLDREAREVLAIEWLERGVAGIRTVFEEKSVPEGALRTVLSSLEQAAVFAPLRSGSRADDPRVQAIWAAITRMLDTLR